MMTCLFIRSALKDIFPHLRSGGRIVGFGALVLMLLFAVQNLDVNAAEHSPETNISEKRFQVTAGVGNYYIGAQGEATIALKAAFDSAKASDFRGGAEIFLAGTPNDVDELDGGGYFVRIWPFAQYLIVPQEGFCVRIKLGPELFAAAAGEDRFIESSGLGLRIGADADYTFSRFKGRDLSGKFGLSLGYLAGNTEVDVYGRTFDESDTMLAFELELGLKWSISDVTSLTLSYLSNWVDSYELDDSIGWDGLALSFGMEL